MFYLNVFDNILKTYIYFCSETFHLLDGDRIATLLAGYFMGLIKKCQLTDLKVGLVQTAYANGASTEYISEHLVVKLTSNCPTMFDQSIY